MTYWFFYFSIISALLKVHVRLMFFLSDLSLLNHLHFSQNQTEITRN